MSDDSAKSFKRIISLSETERLDVQFVPKSGARYLPLGFKYSFNYRAFIKGKWMHLVRWDNSHARCHIDILGSNNKIFDDKRAELGSFENISESVVEELFKIRTAIHSEIAGEDIQRIESLIKNALKT